MEAVPRSLPQGPVSIHSMCRVETSWGKGVACPRLRSPRLGSPQMETGPVVPAAC
jgi:hypothetical protein